MKYDKGSFIVVPSRSSLEGINPIAQTLYMWLCAYAGDTGECFPSRTTLSAKVGCSDNTIDRMLLILLEKGLIKKENRFKNNEKQTNLYTVQILGGTPTASLPTPTRSPGVAPQDGIELNPVLTQSTYLPAGAVITYEDEKPPREKKDGTAPYDRLCKWSEDRRGFKFVARTKQYAALKMAKAADIGPQRLKDRWVELEGKPFHQENGLDWGMVVSSFNRK